MNESESSVLLKVGHQSLSLLFDRRVVERTGLAEHVTALPAPALADRLGQSLRDAFESGSEPPPTPGQLVAMGALQLAMRCLIGAHLGDAIDDAVGPGGMDVSALEERWWLGDFRALEAQIIGQTQAKNPALAAHHQVLGLHDLEEWIDAAWLDAVGGDPRGRDASAAALPGTLLSMLEAPAIAHPESLTEQLRYVREAWATWLTEPAQLLLLRASDSIAEEQRARLGGPGPAELAGLGQPGAGALAGDERRAGLFAVDERDAYSEDEHWMPNLVLLAKQSYVWLHQLSETYGRTISRIDQIPDEELDELASRGITGLWLIGLWERSNASRQIKRQRGNPEAEASAYALSAYRIADRLGGPEALADLERRAEARGIRLAADMVPNHMAIDSEWLAAHPERFLQLDHPPYPNYRFTGPNLSQDDRIEVRLEDGYWDESDAAVVFQCTDTATGQARYVYHGNDGTQMPWNDTAQLNYLEPAVREAVIDTIVDVARHFRVIRFDAAMTLARQHIQRLWFPPPGQGGAIPSRSHYAVEPDQFDRLVPGEFWREVVERIKLRAPDTLLLAEAFWMMEGYFVRTLGMHRVYNSAFMHMLRDEENEKYRDGIKGVLSYSPAMLERYVNFMNNPDEETAVDQFGRGDKYFGIATMMATLPGLPMFGHGQFEGFSEKYGMEYARSYSGEGVDEGLLEHHRNVIVPILRDRGLFSGVRHFALFDLQRPDGSGVDHNVYAFANRSADGQRPSLVLYNNRMARTAGWIRVSAEINEGSTDEPRLARRTLAASLGVRADDARYYGLWELRRKQWLLRSGRELTEQGLYAELEGYGALVFMEVRQLPLDPRWDALAEQAGGAFIDDLDAALEALPPVSGTEIAAEQVPGHVSDEDAEADELVDRQGDAAPRPKGVQQPNTPGKKPHAEHNDAPEKSESRRLVHRWVGQVVDRAWRVVGRLRFVRRLLKEG